MTARASDILGLTRRGAMGAAWPGFLVFALLGEARAATASGDRTPQRWIRRQDEIGRALAAGEMRPLNWCLEVERLAREVDLGQLMATVNRSRLVAGARGSHNDPSKRFVQFLDDRGTPRRMSYAAALFDFEPHNVITPHGHRHMVSAHMVVEGAFRVRNYDRVGDAPGAMIVRPTRDYIAGLGSVSTMCSERDNIHWFVPDGGRRAATFDVIISGIDRGQPGYDIKAIDPYGGVRRRDGAIVAPILDFEVSASRYTAAV